MRRSRRNGQNDEGIELTPHLQSATHLIGQQIVDAAEDDVEVREVLGHGPQCGSGTFVDHRGDQ